MTEVIILSDNESIPSPDNNGPTNWLRKIPEDPLNDFDFPEVEFDCILNNTGQIDKRNDLHRNTKIKSNVHQIATQLSSGSSSNCDDGTTSYKNSKKNDHARRSHTMSDSCESNNDSAEENSPTKKRPKTKTVPKNKQKLTEERLKKQQQLGREKALKAITVKRLKDIRPGECMKFIEVILDESIENFDFNTDIITTLVDANIRYSTTSQLISNSITWKRNIEENNVDEFNQINTLVKTEEIDQILIIWRWNEVIMKIENNEFCTHVSNIKASLPDHKMTLVIFGIKDYFAYNKQMKSKTQSKKTNKNNEFKNYPYVSRKKLETCLNEMQIVTKCNSRLIDSSQEMATMVYQYTKAIAEIPFKLEKSKCFENKFDWYVMGDNKNTVRVDKDGNGLKRLWQQQLCQFTLSSLEIAEAICSVYPTPATLMEAYINSTPDEGVNLLKDIPIRRAAGPLKTTRKVGIELSKKIFIMFSSENGDAVLR